MEGKKKAVTRYVGIDLGKRTYEVAIVEKGGVKKSNGKTYTAGRQALYKSFARLTRWLWKPGIWRSS